MKPSEFNHIILPMRDELLGYALSVTRSEDNAEDLVQEVMLRLWDMRERLSSEGRLKSLAMTMVRNMFLDQQRHESHSAAMPDKIDIAVDDRRSFVTKQGLSVTSSHSCRLSNNRFSA